MRGNAFEHVRDKAATIVVAARRDALAEIIFGVPLGRNVRWARSRTRGDLEAMLFPGPRLPHDADDDPIKVVILSQDIDPSTVFELVGEILRRRPGLKIVFIAQQLDPNVECLVRAQGVHFILAEPVEVTLLERVVRKAVEHETTKRRLARRYA